jgi:microcystin-dependent protein
MSTPYVGQITMFGGNFAPLNYALCNGQLLPISQYTVLFSLIGTYYGGNGTTTFQLPNLITRLPIHQGTGLGLSTYVLGEIGGQTDVAVTTQQMPAHNHALNATQTAANATTISTSVLPGSVTPPAHLYVTQGSGPAPTRYTLAPLACTPTGGNQPHPNMMPSLCISFIIALVGVFPTRG